MIEILGYVTIGIYGLALTYLFAYCALQFDLLMRLRRNPFVSADHSDAGSDMLPFVTIQLPIYNERFVIERLIDQVMDLDYPANRFEVQILDDSDDETHALCAAKAEEYRSRGFNILHITRPTRRGYKAGALQHGMQSARGDFIAIFDADFVPSRDFLTCTIRHFSDPAIGVVQTRWEHINQDYSLLTRVQAFQLNVHFAVEQGGRQAGNYMLQFNGTAGVWRRKTIEDAGGWQADTLTEDLDLSYRAQLRGWHIRYLDEVGSPAELPAEMSSLKSQQYRWMKGGAETARKILPKVWKSDMPFGAKVHATGHLMSSTVFLFVLLVSVLSVPVLFLLKPLAIDPKLFSLFLIGWVAVGIVYYSGNTRRYWGRRNRWSELLRFAYEFPVFLALSMGLSFHNSVAVIQGLRGHRSAFIRTPKFDIRSVTDPIRYSNYLPDRLPASTFVEGLLAIYFLGAIIAAIVINDPTFIIFHLLLAFGFGTICFYSIRHYRAFSS